MPFLPPRPLRERAANEEEARKLDADMLIYGNAFMDMHGYRISPDDVQEMLMPDLEPLELGIVKETDRESE